VCIPIMLMAILKVKDFLKSLAVTYSIKVVISGKWCKMETCYFRPVIGNDVSPVQ